MLLKMCMCVVLLCGRLVTHILHMSHSHLAHLNLLGIFSTPI